MRLSEAQQSALECSSLTLVGEMPDMFTAEELTLAAAWDGGRRLAVGEAQREACFSALTDLANAADEAGERGACRSFTALASRVLRGKR